MINPFVNDPIFECTGRLLISRPALPPAPTQTFKAEHPDKGMTAIYVEGHSGPVSGMTDLILPERRELAQAMINWWRAWGGVP